MTLGQAMFSALITAATGVCVALITGLFARAAMRNERLKFYGALTQRVDDIDRRVDDLAEDRKRQWEHISKSEVQIANLRGRHKLNGESK